MEQGGAGHEDFCGLDLRRYFEPAHSTVCPSYCNIYSYHVFTL